MIAAISVNCVKCFVSDFCGAALRISVQSSSVFLYAVYNINHKLLLFVREEGYHGSE